MARVLDCACKIIDFGMLVTFRGAELVHGHVCVHVSAQESGLPLQLPSMPKADQAIPNRPTSPLLFFLKKNFAVASLFGADHRLVHGKYTFFKKSKCFILIY
jgi:hypothetical protein